ncbi:MAG: selenocysteine-specific translation elongation factor [Firmicutes bacterium]|nr:selenocysteine-specific translation elongation factor [Bacillota bacterium]
MIIGTAGHVDHGKTELIKALTGTDTDRLKEEKKRGISIDLGFAPFQLPSGRLAGIVDVPGHERFIHNMLAGVGGIDLVLMVVDATEGVMPQTKEHLDILELLQIKKGIIVVTKIDLVDKEWLELIIEEIKEAFTGTFLANSPLHLVSAITKQGIENLRETVALMAEKITAGDRDAPLRLPVDRVFSLSGFGTVVTGTILNGTVKTGETVEVTPPGRNFRVRGIQVHGEGVAEAFAGQRTALNLAGLEKEGVLRGSVVAAPGYFHTTRRLDAKLKLLSTAPRPLTNMVPVHFYLGTARAVASLYLLENTELLPGKECFVQCRLDKPLIAQRGDRFIIRSYSPVVTIGGGKVLDERPLRHKRFHRDVLERLQELEKGDPLPFVLQKITAVQAAPLSDLSHLTKMTPQRLEALLQRAAAEGKVALFGDLYVTAADRGKWEKEIMKELEHFHTEKPLLPGAPKSRIGRYLPRKIAGPAYDAFLEHLKSKGLLISSGDVITKKGFIPRPTPGQEKKLAAIENLFKKSGLTPPAPKDLCIDLGLGKGEAVDLLDYLAYRGVLVKIAAEIYLQSKVYEHCLQVLKDYLQKNPRINLAQYRDLLQTSRKYAQALLEHFDSCKYTRRLGDERVARKLV